MAGAVDCHDSSQQVLLNQLEEILGFQDPSFLHEALKVLNGDITMTVSLLTNNRIKEPSQDTIAIEPPEVEGSAANKKVLAKVIGLTHENKDDHQALIILSLLKSSKFWRLVGETLIEYMRQPLQKLNIQKETL